MRTSYVMKLGTERSFLMLQLKNISKSYDGVTILKNINLEIEKGEIVSILGPSGSGDYVKIRLS